MISLILPITSIRLGNISLELSKVNLSVLWFAPLVLATKEVENTFEM